MMHTQQLSTEQLFLEIEQLRRELADVKQEKADLEILLETTTTHADTIEIQLQESNKQLKAEIVERQRAAALLKAFAVQLQSLVEMVSQEKADLEILLETATEHGDFVEELLFDKAQEVIRESQRKLVQFLEAVPVGVGILDAQGKPYYGNRIAKQLLGKLCVPSATVEDLSEAYQVYRAGTNQPYPSDRLPGVRALKGESATIDDLEIRKGDKIIPLEAWETPIFDEKGNIAYAIVAFQDISQRKWIEAECKKFTEELFQLNEALSRFVPRQFLQFLHKESIVDVQLGDQVQKEMSVLFADIRDFTTLSESMTPQQNFNFINAYLSRMEPAVMENQGFIDKYIGDEIMALFDGGADNAVKAGIEMLQRLTEYNQHRANSGYVPIQIGIGINTGSLMLGTVGGASRMDSTVISDAVNLASRLERLTKNYGVSLLISHHTFLQLEDYNQYAFRIIDRLNVRGKSRAVSVYEVFDADLPPIYEGKLVTKKEFEEALLLYNLGSFTAATQLFEKCLQVNPKDTVAQIYLKRCREHIT
ncbi:MAG: adenylate cyclase [Cyanobacteriota bacterium]|nr:adenylate cyclase [Cyanobacteriota bacterium]